MSIRFSREDIDKEGFYAPDTTPPFHRRGRAGAELNVRATPVLQPFATCAGNFRERGRGRDHARGRQAV